MQITGGTHHIFRFATLQQRAAALLVCRLYCVYDLPVGDIQRAHFLGSDHNLILTHHPADTCHFRHIRYRFQLKLERPVLKCA
ncbi:hypothetical protein D3C78_1814030 [compost metagenome]